MEFSRIVAAFKSEDVVACTPEDIAIHYESLRSIIESDVTEIKYKARMFKAVTENTAFKIKDDSSFLYYLKVTKTTAEGVTFWGKAEGMFTLFVQIFFLRDKDTILVRMMPHISNGPTSYKSMLTKGSIKKWYSHGKHAVIRIDKIREKGKRLLKLNKKDTS